MFKLDKKSLVIVGSVLIGLLLLGLIWFFLGRPETGSEGNQPTGAGQANLPAPEYLSETEKTALGISADLRVQALGRDESGAVSVYKIINSDADLVLDPNAVAPLSPRLAAPEESAE